MNLEDILKLGLAAYSASKGDAAGAASGLTGIFGPIFGSGSQPAGGIGGKSSGDFLSSIFESSSPTGESPASQGGFLDSLGNIFGTGEGSPTGYTGPSVLPGVLGGLASSFRATPRAGATRKERDKANQYNMIAGILGALATGYGKASDEAAKQKATSELYQIFSGAQPTAVPAAEGAEAAPVQSRSERLNEFIRNNPAMASSAMELLGKEEENRIKQMDVLRKATTGGLREVDLYNIAESRGILPEDRASWVEAEKQKRAQEGLSALGLFGLGSPKQPASANLTQIPAPEIAEPQNSLTQPTKQPARQNTVAQDILRKTEQGEEFDITVPPDQAESVIKGLEQGGYEEQPVTAKPNFLTPEEQRGAERRQQERATETKKAEVKAVGEWFDRNKEPFSEIRTQSTNAPRTYDIIVSQLMSNDPSVQQNGLTALLAARDESVVQIGELDRFNETVYTPLEKLNRQAQALLGKRVPLPENIRDALIASARDVRDIKKQAGNAAEKSIRKAAKANAEGNFDISGISEYEKNYKSIRDWLGEKNRNQNNSIMSTPSSVQMAPTQSYRPRRIMKIEPLG